MVKSPFLHYIGWECGDSSQGGPTDCLRPNCRFLSSIQYISVSAYVVESSPSRSLTVAVWLHGSAHTALSAHLGLWYLPSAWPLDHLLSCPQPSVCLYLVVGLLDWAFSPKVLFCPSILR